MSRNITWDECSFWGCDTTLEVKDNKAALIVNAAYDTCGAQAIAQTAMTSADQEVSVIWSWSGIAAIYPLNWYVYLFARRNTSVCGYYVAGVNCYWGRFGRNYSGGANDRAQIYKHIGTTSTALANIVYTIASGSEAEFSVVGTHLVLLDDSGFAADAYDSDLSSGDYVGFALAWNDQNYSGSNSDMVLYADDFCANNL